MRTALAFLVGIAFSSLTGCATIFSGTAEEVTVNSHPGNASVEIKAPNGNRTSR